MSVGGVWKTSLLPQTHKARRVTPPERRRSTRLQHYFVAAEHGQGPRRVVTRQLGAACGFDLAGGQRGHQFVVRCCMPASVLKPEGNPTPPMFWQVLRAIARRGCWAWAALPVCKRWASQNAPASVWHLAWLAAQPLLACGGQRLQRHWRGHGSFSGMLAGWPEERAPSSQGRSWPLFGSGCRRRRRQVVAKNVIGNGAKAFV